MTIQENDQAAKDRIVAVLLETRLQANDEIEEKIRLALEAIVENRGWLDAFSAGYYTSWAEGLANQQQSGTPLCKKLNELMNLLSVKPGTNQKE